MDSPDNGKTDPPTQPAEDSQAATKTLSLAANLGDAWDQKAKAQRKWVEGNGSVPTFTYGSGMANIDSSMKDINQTLRTPEPQDQARKQRQTTKSTAVEREQPRPSTWASYATIAKNTKTDKAPASDSAASQRASKQPVDRDETLRLGTAENLVQDPTLSMTPRSITDSVVLPPSEETSRRGGSKLVLPDQSQDSLNVAASIRTAARSNRRHTPTTVPPQRSADEVLELPGSTTRHSSAGPVIGGESDDSGPSPYPTPQSITRDSYSRPGNSMAGIPDANPPRQRPSHYSFGCMNLTGDSHVMIGPAADSEQSPNRTNIEQSFGVLNFVGNSFGNFGTIIHNYAPTLLGGLQALSSDATDDAHIQYRISRSTSQVCMRSHNFSTKLMGT